MSLLAVQNLRPAQAAALSLLLRHRRLLLVLPRQFGGKTELGCRAGADFISRSGRVSRNGLFLAKDHNSAKKAANEKFSRLCDERIYGVNTEKITCTPKKLGPTNTHYLGSVDKDPDRQRGGTYGYVHWSEAAFSKIEHGESIIGVLQKVVLPTTALTGGYILVETTLNGKNGFWELWENAAQFNFHRFRVGLGDMVNLGWVTEAEYIETQKSYHPDVFRQEFECEFVSFQGRVFPEFDEAKHVDENMPWPESWQIVSFGLDWGFRDATAVLFAYVEKGVMHVFDEHYAKEELVAHTAEAIETRRRQFGVQRMAGVCDHDPNRNAELNLRGIETANADKVNVLGAVMQIKEAFYFDRLRIHPRCKNLLRELQNCTWHPKKADLGEFNESQDTVGHHDSIAALRYLVRMLSEHEAERPAETPHVATDAMSARAYHRPDEEWQP